MEFLTNLHQRQQPLHILLHQNRPSFSRPISSISFKTLPSPLSPFSTNSSSTFKFSSIQALPSSSSSSFSEPLPRNPENPKPPFLETLKPLSSAIIKTTCISIAAAAIFFTRLTHKPLAVIAAPIAPSNVEPAKESANGVTDEERERTLEEYLDSHPDDVQALRSLMEAKIKNRKLQEAIEVLDRLIQIEPNDCEWPLLKAHIHSYSGDSELAKLEFEEILAKDTLRVEAYHGLVMAVSQSESGEELKDVMKKIEVAMERCKKEKKKEDLRDFKLLVAQIRVIEGNYTDALKVYQDLVKEEPRDFRPYLCQGIIYTLLRKKDEAEKQFQKYRRLVPKEHPYARYFDDNMIATKVFSQKVESERAGSKS